MLSEEEEDRSVAEPPPDESSFLLFEGGFRHHTLTFEMIGPGAPLLAHLAQTFKESVLKLAEGLVS